MPPARYASHSVCTASSIVPRGTKPSTSRMRSALMWYDRRSSVGRTTIDTEGSPTCRRTSSASSATVRFWNPTLKTARWMSRTGGRREQPEPPRHILDVEIGPELRASKDRDLALDQGMERQDIHRQVQSKARGVAAHRRRPHDHPLAAIVERRPEQLFTEELVGRIVRQRLAGCVLAHVRLLLNPVDA